MLSSYNQVRESPVIQKVNTSNNVWLKTKNSTKYMRECPYISFVSYSWRDSLESPLESPVYSCVYFSKSTWESRSRVPGSVQSNFWCRYCPVPWSTYVLDFSRDHAFSHSFARSSWVTADGKHLAPLSYLAHCLRDLIQDGMDLTYSRDVVWVWSLPQWAKTLFKWQNFTGTILFMEGCTLTDSCLIYLV